MRTCIGCGDPLPERTGPGRPPVWCKKECRKAHPDARLAGWQYGARRAATLTVAVTPDMYERVQFCAGRAGMTVSQWIAELIGDTFAVEDADAEDVA